MEKEFVPYEIALKLKELGFDGECLAFITPMEKWMITNYKGEPSAFLKYDVGNKMYIKTVRDPFGDNLRRSNQFVRNSKFIKANKNIALPLWQQAIDWLRDEKGFYVEVYPFIFSKSGKLQWSYTLYEVTEDCIVSGLEGGETLEDTPEFPSYEKAREAGIIYAIEWIVTR